MPKKQTARVKRFALNNNIKKFGQNFYESDKNGNGPYHNSMITLPLFLTIMADLVINNKFYCHYSIFIAKTYKSTPGAVLPEVP